MAGRCDERVRSNTLSLVAINHYMVFGESKIAMKISLKGLNTAGEHGESLSWPLTEKMNRLAEIDDFMNNLWEVHTKVKAEGYAQVRDPHRLAFSFTCSCVVDKASSPFPWVFSDQTTWFTLIPLCQLQSRQSSK